MWLKEIAPSSSLRKWFGHDPQRWPEFCQRYEAELKEKGAVTNLLKKKSDQGILTLVFSARDAERSNAVALKKYLESL
jgi:uncharacterized protein YeaO (DUF488 family)